MNEQNIGWIHPEETVIEANLKPEAQPKPEAEAPEETVAEVDDNGVLEVGLFRPLKVDGDDIVHLTLDVGGLSEADLSAIDGDMRAAKDTSPRNVAFSTSYCMRIAARACGISYRDLQRLSLKDSVKISTALQNFLLV